MLSDVVLYKVEVEAGNTQMLLGVLNDVVLRLRLKPGTPRCCLDV